MSSVYGLYPDPDSAQRAYARLRAAGIADREITVISAEPFEDYGFSHRDKATWLYWIGGCGGAVGLAFGTWLTSMTEKAWPLSTGGMPIVSNWTNLVVLFELTMLTAIVSTVVALLITTKLPRRQPTLYDLAISDGQILVGVEGAASLDDVERILQTDGAVVRRK